MTNTDAFWMINDEEHQLTVHVFDELTDDEKIDIADQFRRSGHAVEFYDGVPGNDSTKPFTVIVIDGRGYGDNVLHGRVVGILEKFEITLEVTPRTLYPEDGVTVEGNRFFEDPVQQPPARRRTFFDWRSAIYGKQAMVDMR